MKATINGQEREIPGGLTLGALLEALGTPRTGIAVARNDRVVARAQLDSLCIVEGDRIEIIRAVAGG